MIYIFNFIEDDLELFKFIDGHISCLIKCLFFLINIILSNKIIMTFKVNVSFRLCAGRI